MFEWEHGSLGELANGVRGVSYTPNQLQSLISPETVILLRSNNIRDGKVNFDNIQLIPSHIVSKGQLAKHDDIAVCMSNGSKALVGKSGRIVGNAAPCTVGAFCSIFRPFPHADGKFVSYILQSNAYRRHLDIILAGSAINNLKNSDVEALPLEIPPKEEQRLIARILDTLDTQIQKTEALIAKLEKVKEGLLHDLLTRGIDESGQLRPSPEQAPELYKESSLGLIPREWSISSVGREFEIQLGKMLDAERNSGEMKPYLGNKSVQWGAIDLNEVGKVRLTGSDIIKFRLASGDLLVCEGGDIGRAALWEGQMEECYYQKALHRLRAKNKLFPRFMLQVFFLWGERNTLSDYASQTSIAHLPKEKLETVPVPVPSKHEQEIITYALQSHELTLKAEIGALFEMHKIKSGLMEDLLSGRVRVTQFLEKTQATTPA